MVGFLSGIAGGATVAITIKAIDQFSGTFKKAETTASKFGAVGKAALVGFTVAAVAAGVAITKLASSSIKAAAEFEQTQVAFTTLLGSAEAAEDKLKELSDFAKATPFTLQGVEKSARQLLAVGFEADELIPTLRNVGDVAAGLGLGEEGLQRLILNLGQVRTQGKLTGRELRDFAVAGVPILQVLADQMGVTKEAITEMISAGEITSEAVTSAFRAMSEEGGKFENLMAKQADTVLGKFSNLKDTLSLMGREIGAELLPVVSDLADTFLNDVLPAIKPLIPLFTDLVKKAMIGLADLLPKILPTLMRLAEIFFRLFDALSPVVDIILDSLILGLDLFMDVLEPLLPIIKSLGGLLGDIFEILRPLIEVIASVTSAILTLAGTAIGRILIGALRLVEPLLTAVADALSWIIGLIGDAIKWIGRFFGIIDDEKPTETTANAISTTQQTLDEQANESTSQTATPTQGDRALDPSQRVTRVNEPIALNPRTVLDPIALNDFILTSNGKLLQPSPQDTIIGTKGGIGTTITVNIDSVQGLDPDMVAEALETKLSRMIRQ